MAEKNQQELGRCRVGEGKAGVGSLERTHSLFRISKSQYHQDTVMRRNVAS
jgi:hypothetical protein